MWYLMFEDYSYDNLLAEIRANHVSCCCISFPVNPTCFWSAARWRPIPYVSTGLSVWSKPEFSAGSPNSVAFWPCRRYGLSYWSVWFWPARYDGKYVKLVLSCTPTAHIEFFPVHRQIPWFRTLAASVQRFCSWSVRFVTSKIRLVSSYGHFYMG